MTDVFDRAQERELEMRQDALAEQARHAALPTGESALVCVECDMAIPLGRRLALPGVTTCIECQTAKERAAKWA